MSQERIKAEVVSPGITTGTLVDISMTVKPPGLRSKMDILDPELEYRRFEEETGAVIHDLEEAVQSLRRDLFLEEAEIIQTHIFMLNDPEFRRKIRKRIVEDSLAVEYALEQVLREMVAVFEKSDNLVFLEKIADIKDVMGRLKRKLQNEDEAIFYRTLADVSDPVVVLKELLPSYVIETKKMDVKAIVTENGTSISHAAILAKSFGIPVLKVQNVNVLAQKNQVAVLVDAQKGELIFNPDERSLKIVKNNNPTEVQQDEEDLPLNIWLNIIDHRQLNSRVLTGVQGIGLFRTEFFYMEKKDNFPTEEELYIHYTALFKKCPVLPITVRSLDIGGDKSLSYFSFGPQENPYLGFRAHRIFRFHPEIFLNQLRAILRAGVYAEHIRILYPMIESVDELLFMMDLFQNATDSLKRENADFNRDVEQGVLIEVPSAAWIFKDILQYVEFASIGSNDLFQYFFAVDRNNANVTQSYRPENPASLKLIKSMIDTAKKLEKPLSICGEIAKDQFFLPILIGLGVEHISIDYHAVQDVKTYLAGVDPASCKQMAKKCINAKTSTEVHEIVSKYNSTGTQYMGFSDTGGAGHVDPVCKMVVYTDEKSLTVRRNGEKYYFCSVNCRDTFLERESHP